MSGAASLALQKAIVAALRANSGIAGVADIFDGPPPRAAFPYLTVGETLSSDWSTKTARGREVRAAVTLWDDGETPSRLQDLMHAAETAIETLPRDLDGWRIASAVFLRSLIARNPARPWAGLIEFRFRLLEA